MSSANESQTHGDFYLGHTLANRNRTAPWPSALGDGRPVLKNMTGNGREGFENTALWRARIARRGQILTGEFLRRYALLLF